MRKKPQDNAYMAKPRVRLWRAHGRYRPPGPTRRFDRRHWLHQDRNFWFFMLFGFGTFGFWIGCELGLWG